MASSPGSRLLLKSSRLCHHPPTPQSLQGAVCGRQLVICVHLPGPQLREIQTHRPRVGHVPLSPQSHPSSLGSCQLNVTEVEQRLVGRPPRSSMEAVGREDLRKGFFFSRPGFGHLLDGVSRVGGHCQQDPVSAGGGVFSIILHFCTSRPKSPLTEKEVFLYLLFT